MIFLYIAHDVFITICSIVHIKNSFTIAYLFFWTDSNTHILYITQKSTKTETSSFTNDNTVEYVVLQNVHVNSSIWF